MGQVPLHMDAGGHQLVRLPEALAQVAQVGHDDDAVGPSLPQALLLQGVQGGRLALQGHVAQCHGVRQLGETGDADQQEGALHACGAAAGHLLQAAGADLGRARLPHDLGHRGHALHALDDAAHGDAALMAAGNHLVGVMIQPVQMDLQTGKLPVHGFHLVCDIAILAVILV